MASAAAVVVVAVRTSTYCATDAMAYPTRWASAKGAEAGVLVGKRPHTLSPASRVVPADYRSMRVLAPNILGKRKQGYPLAVTGHDRPGQRGADGCVRSWPSP